MRSGRSRALVAVVVALGMLSGCAQQPAPREPSPEPPESSMPSTSPDAEPTRAAPDPSDPSTWIISDQGVGPVEIGGDLAATMAELPDTWTNDPENCAWTAWWNAPDSSYGIYFARGTESETAPISEVSVYSTAEPGEVAAPVTADGLGIGSTRDEVLGAHPEATEGASQIGTGSWIILEGDADAHVFFEFREGESTASSVVVTIRDQPSYEVCG